jgi:hypothetical protein
MRTGSIGNRDSETLINTLPEPKRSIISKLRNVLLNLSFEEAADYDAINVESYLSYSSKGQARIMLKHKWKLSAIILLQNNQEKVELTQALPETAHIEFGKSEDGSGIFSELDPDSDSELIFKIANYFSGKK